MNLPQTMSHRPAAAVVATLAVAALTACGTNGDFGADASGDGADDVEVVASTNIYASIADAVIGEPGYVSAIIEDMTTDPHSFEASPADATRITNADLVVYNGAGYDAFIDQALDTTAGIPTVVGTEAFESATDTIVDYHDHDHDRHDHDHDHDHDHAESSQNEHVWTSLPTVRVIAEQIAEELGQLDPGNAEAYTQNATDFTARIDNLENEVENLRQTTVGSEYAQSEDIGQYLFDSLGLIDVTPPAFLSAIHADSDPSARDFDAMMRLVSAGEVEFFAYNTQTETAVTTQIREAAEANDVAVVELTETLPEDMDYLTWIEDIAARSSEALEQ